MFMTRRNALLSLSGLAGVVVSGCTFNQQQTQWTLSQIQSYVTSFVNMVDAAALVYLNSPTAKDKEVVQQILIQVRSLNEAVQDATAPSDTKTLLLQLIQFVQEIEPDIAPYLGANAPYVALGLAVLQAIIDAVPVPQPAPTPAQMDDAVVQLKAAHPGVKFKR